MRTSNIYRKEVNSWSRSGPDCNPDSPSSGGATNTWELVFEEGAVRCKSTLGAGVTLPCGTAVSETVGTGSQNSDFGDCETSITCTLSERATGDDVIPFLVSHLGDYPETFILDSSPSSTRFAPQGFHPVDGGSGFNPSVTQSQWRVSHTASPTCYLKIWLRQKDEFDDGSAPVYTPVEPYTWTATGDPCVEDVFAEILGPINEIAIPDASGRSVIEIWGWSFYPGYDPTATEPAGANGRAE